MPLQLLIDIGLFLIYCGLFTLLIAWTWKFWMLYVNTTWKNSLRWTTIEIKLPREINKSPEAAEIFLRSLIEGGGLGTWFKEKWEGRIPNYSSLEIASLEGVIHFYIRLESKLKPRVEAAIYSQYPNVEIVELAEDYMDQIPKVTRFKDSAATWASEWVLAKGGEAEVGNKDKTGKKDDTIDKLKYKGDMYPIKTYKDWGLDKDPKEIYKHDPLTYVLEQMGSIGKGEYFLYQILIRDAAKWNEIYDIEKNGDEKNKEKGKKLSDLVKLELEKYKVKWSLKKKGELLGFDEYGMPKTKEQVKTPEEKDKDGKVIKKAEMETVELVYKRAIAESKPIPINEREDDAKKNIELIQRKMSKPQVIAIIRTVYVSDSYKEFGSRIPMVMGITKPFNEDGFNTFKPDNVTDPNDFPWQNTLKKVVPWIRENTFGDLIGRDGFFSFNKGSIDKEKAKSFKKKLDIIFFNSPNLNRKLFTTFWNVLVHPFSPTISFSGFTLNVEELATLYHFPGEVAATPSLPRIDSVKGSSPSNLPIER